MPERPASAVARTVLAFDFGLKRIGVALGNTITGSARPLGTIEEESNDSRFSAISSRIAQWEPDLLVVGKPLDSEGRDTDMTARAERFGRQLAGRFGLPVEFADERFSSAVVESALKPNRDNKALVDAAAAAVILQAWLDETHHAHS